MTDRGATTGYVLRLLGGAWLERGGAVQTGPATQRHRLALLALLATSYPRGLTRDKLVGLLWPEREIEAARNLLKQSVHVLRRSLGEHAILSAGEDVRLNPDALQCDVIDFQQALEREDLEHAVKLHGGPFLDGFFLSEANGFEHWADEQRQRLRQGYRRALERMADAEANRGDWPAAIAWLRRLLADDPCDAGVTIRLAQALDRSGDRTGAIRQARVHAALLAQELGAVPDPNVEALAESLRSAPPAVPATIGISAHSGPVQPAPAARGAQARPVLHPRVRRALGLGAVTAAAIAALSVRLPDRGVPAVGRLAVLPLENLTGDPGQDHFVAGMHDALVTELGRSPDLTVISRQAVLRYHGPDRPFQQVARDLNVEALVEGAVFRVADSIRVTVKLVGAATGEQIWAASHHDALVNALVLQREVALSLVRAVRGRFSSGTEASRYLPNDPVTRDLYLRGLHHLEQFEIGALPVRAGLDTLRRSIAYLEEAVAREPSWAAAHARLGHAYHWLASAVPTHQSEYYPKAKAAVLRALELDDREARAHASLAFIRYFFEQDWAGAEESYRQAMSLDPNAYHGSYGLYLATAGRYEDAIESFRLAEERDPLSRTLKRRLVEAYFCAKQYDEALAHQELMVRIWPEREGLSLLGLRGNAYSMGGRHAEAIAAYREAVARSDSTTWAVAGLAYVLARAGDPAARDLMPLLDSRGHADPVLLAALGDHERAVATLEAQFTEWGWRAFLRHRCFPEFPALQSAPRIGRLVDQTTGLY